MDHTYSCRTEEYEVDLVKLAGSVFRKGWLVAAASVAGAVLALAATCFFLKPEYEASVLLYVDNGAATSITASDISASRELVDSCIVILKTVQTMEEVADYAKADRSSLEMEKMIAAEAADSTQLLRVTAKSPDPREAEKIADAVAHVLPERISGIIAGASVKTVDTAAPASGPDVSGHVRNALIGFLLGFALSSGGIVIRALLDTTIHTEADIALCCSYPVLAELPDADPEAVDTAAAEAYRLLRTKLQHLLAEENKAHIIAVTGVVHREGKYLTANGLTQSLSRLGKRGILVDCDLSQTAGTEGPNLSEYLRGECSLEALLRQCAGQPGAGMVSAIPAGSDPENIPELLCSQKMLTLLAELAKISDYVILDMPPVGVRWDALPLAGKTEGTLLVVRKSLCDRHTLADTARQFEFVDAKILGIVLSSAAGSGKTEQKRFGKERKKKAREAAEYGSLF